MTAAHIGVLPETVLEQLVPAHEAALACITFAAGSELVLEQLRASARLVGWLSFSMCGCSFAIVFVLMLTLLTFFPALAGAAADSRHARQRSAPTLTPAPAPAPTRLRGRDRVNVVIAMLAAVVAIARSPSSAIAVVSELQADGPFTQTMLGVTMVTDVVVILLFMATVRLQHTATPIHPSLNLTLLATPGNNRPSLARPCSTTARPT